MFKAILFGACMCGIIGVLSVNDSEKTAQELLIGLKRLEYRGYDSWGYALLSQSGLIVEKKIGRIVSPSAFPSTHLMLGHTRWATHGNITDENAHPHTDCTNRIAVIHNGIIENYLTLRQQLMGEGHRFKSQTDTEIIAHLFEKTSGTLLEKAQKIAPLLKGSFSLVVMDQSYPDELVAIKYESPLALGIAKNELIFASDPLAFLDKTNQVIFLSEGDIAHAKKVGTELQYSFFNYLTQNTIEKKPITVQWNIENTSLEKYAHYMQKEIMEQPLRMRDALDQQTATKFAEIMKNKKVIAIACGTARHAAVIGKHLLHKIAHFSMEVMMAHEFTYFTDDLDKNTVLLAVSQSGETADVMDCVRKAKQKGVTIISIVNVPSSTLARESDFVFYINCGPEIAVASTKAFTNQVIAFYLISFALAGTLETEIPRLRSIILDVEKTLIYFDIKSREVAQYLASKEHAYMLGKGIHFPIALEGALKLKEVSYIHAEGMPSGELKHGTLALIEPGTPVILLCPRDYTYHDTISNGLETKARGAYVIGISDMTHPSFNSWIQLPSLEKENHMFYPLFEIMPLQLIAYYTAVLLKRDVDKPRNLAKSLTVK